MKSLRYLAVTLMMLAVSATASAQCVMCKAAAESSLEGGQAGIALGLNDGIFYLAAFPYIIVLILIYLYKRRQSKLEATS